MTLLQGRKAARSPERSSGSRQGSRNCRKQQRSQRQWRTTRSRQRPGRQQGSPAGALSAVLLKTPLACSCFSSASWPAAALRMAVMASRAAACICLRTKCKLGNGRNLQHIGGCICAWCWVLLIWIKWSRHNVDERGHAGLAAEAIGSSNPVSTCICLQDAARAQLAQRAALEEAALPLMLDAMVLHLRIPSCFLRLDRHAQASCRACFQLIWPRASGPLVCNTARDASACSQSAIIAAT